MEEVYRGNGFVVKTNDSGELFISLESKPSVEIRLGSNGLSRDDEMMLSYKNTTLEVTPLEYKMFVIHDAA